MPPLHPDDLALLQKVAHALKRRLPPHVQEEELIQWGWFGLEEARKRFDPTKGVKFQTYAAPRVRGAILDALRKLDWASRLARRRGSAIPAMHSLDARRRDGKRFYDCPDERTPEHLGLEERDAIDRGLTYLKGDLHRVVQMNLAGKNLREIGEVMGLSESRVSQIRARAYAILRVKIVRPCQRRRWPA